MLLSLNWLKNYVTIPEKYSAPELQDIITTSIAEVEGFVQQKRENIIVGKILSIEPHPNADRLKVTKVTDGEKEFQIVCGGTNLSEGMLVAVALIGAKVNWHGEATETVMEKAKLRGVESEGMICASCEIGLPFVEDEKEVLDLKGKVTESDIGKNLYDALGMDDTIFEIDNKSLTHRPDLFGHYGFARDIFAVLKNQFDEKIELKSYPQNEVIFGKEKLNIEIQSPICRRFSAALVKGIKIESSPTWLQQALQKVGVRSINNIVDVTNFVMNDLGQPMHSYDYDEIAGAKLTVRQAKGGEEMIALNEKTYKLSNEDSVISDEKKAVLITGIMGNQNSGVTEKTTSILLEAGSWDPLLVRKTSQRIGLRSDSSGRFEKNLDPAYTHEAIIRAVNLIKEICPESTIESELFEYKKEEYQAPKINLDLAYCAKLLGREIDAEKAATILTDLGCTVEKSPLLRGTDLPQANQGDILLVTPPSWRTTKDLLHAEDLIEEIGRVIGYHTVPYTAPEGMLFPHIDAQQVLERKIKNTFALRLNYHEVDNYLLTSPENETIFGFESVKRIKIANPLTNETSDVKTSLIPDLIKNAGMNAHDKDHFKLFELNRLYTESLLPHSSEGGTKGGCETVNETRSLAGILVQPKNKTNDPYKTAFYAVKDDLEKLLTTLGIEAELKYDSYEPTNDFSLLANGKKATISIPLAKGDSFTAGGAGGYTQIGTMGNIDSTLQAKFDLDQVDVAVFELDINALKNVLPSEKKVKPLPKFPSVKRDIAFELPSSTSSLEIEKALNQPLNLITKIELFDIYEKEGSRSLAYHLTFSDPEKTLTENDIAKAMSEVEKIITKLGATLRS